MEEVVAFSRWVGLVVAVFAALLVAPRATAAFWQHARRGFRRLDDGPLHTPVQVREGVRAGGGRHLLHLRGPDALDDVELLDTHGTVVRARGRVDLRPLLDLVDRRATLVLLTGLLLVFAGDLVRLLPGGVVMAGDLALVLVTFLVMRHVVYTYVPVDRVLERTSPLVARAHAPFDQLLRVVLLSAALVLLVTWPSQVGWQLASSGLDGELRDSRVLVAWACELPWLLGLSWLVVRQRLTAGSPASSRR